MSDTYNGIFLANNDGTGKEYGGGGNSGSDNAVLYTEQTLTSEQKEQARSNIDSASIDDLNNEVATRSKLGAKNLLPNYYDCDGLTLNDITFIENADGSFNISCNTQVVPTAFGMVLSSRNFKLLSGYYIASMENASDNVAFEVNAYNNDTYVRRLARITSSTEASFNADYSDFNRIGIYVSVLGGDFSTPVTFYPMLRLATDADNTYEPYAKTNKELTDRTSGLSNENLLDNPFFTVNQRGQSSYSGNVYAVDRWHIGDNGSVSFSNDVLTVTKVNTYAMIYQYFDTKLINALISKKVTVSVTLDDNSILKGTTTFALNTTLLKEQDITVGFTTDLLRIYSSTATFAIKAIKLEVGEVSTLSLDTPRPYAEELVRCQTSTADSNDDYANKNIVTSASIKNISIGTSDMTTGVTVLPTGDLYIMYE